MPKSICTVDGCDRPTRCKGLCNLHYLRLRTHGDVMADVPPAHQGSIKTADVCSIDGCDRPFKGQGLCNMHLIRKRRHGSIMEHVPGQIYLKTCLVADCSSKPHARGYCSKHLRRFLIYGDPLAGVIYQKICQESECGRKVVALGLCSRHYRQKQYRDNPLAGVLKVERRRALRNSVQSVDYDAQHVAWRFAMFGNCCWICGSGENLTIDHVKPLKHRGPDMPANLRPACRPCNSRKRDIWPGVGQLQKFFIN